jgi:hypothetical protein
VKYHRRDVTTLLQQHSPRILFAALSVRLLKMSTPTPEGRSIPRRTFGVQDSDVRESPERESNVLRRVSSRISFWSSQRRSSFTPWWGRKADDGAQELHTPTSGRAPIPTMMQSSGEVYTTPLPILSMVVLSIVRSIVLISRLKSIVRLQTMLGEFLSANVSTPFLLFMVKGTDIFLVSSSGNRR